MNRKPINERKKNNYLNKIKFEIKIRTIRKTWKYKV